MHKIYKYPIKLMSENEVLLPVAAEILHIGVQDGILYLWAMFNTEVKQEALRKIYVIGTGFPFNKGNKKHLTTVLMSRFVWHIFEETN
jgi:hypothetical protein